MCAVIISSVIAVVHAPIPPPKASKMRKKEETDRELFDLQYENFVWVVDPKNPLMAELAAIDKLLDEVPEILDWIHADLCKQTNTAPGRPAGATSEQILRSAIVMQLRGLHYRQLAHEIDANPVYRKFTRFYGKKIPHFTRLNDLIKMISPETMEKVNVSIVGLGIKKKSKTVGRFAMTRPWPRPTLPIRSTPACSMIRYG